MKSQASEVKHYVIFSAVVHPLTSVKEHVTNDCRAAVNFERVSAQYDSLQHNTLRVAAEQTACSHEVLGA